MAFARFVCVAAAALAGSRAVVEAFPGRAGAASLWCPEASLADGLDPVLQRVVAEGPHADGDSGVPENTPPPWYDRQRFAAGQRLTERYPMSIVYAHIHALYMVMAVPSVLDVLVYTGNSDTPDEAWDRYYDTVTGVGSWYSSDIYEPGTWGYEQLKRVRGLHRMVRRDMNERPDQDGVRNRTRLGGNFSGCRASAAVRRDLEEVAKSACPFRRRSPTGLDNTIHNTQDNEKPNVWMNQYDMAMTQWAFVAPVILHPEKYGLTNASEELLDGFVHMWETIGYSLGIEDKFNMCQGGLNATLLRARQAMATIVLPQMRHARPPWEYMARCMADGLAYFIPGADFNSQLEIMLRDTLDAPVPSVTALLSPLQRESVKGYRGIMEALRNDRENWFFRPVSSAGFYILRSRARLIPKDGIKLLRHRNPHRSKDCFAEIRT